MDIQQEYKVFTGYINEYITGERKVMLLDMYDENSERLLLSPASGVDHYHNAFPGGYVNHVNRVCEFSLEVYELYKKMGMDVSNFTVENLIFSAINHDLGKLGFPGEGREAYIPNKSEWHRKNMGKIYEHNTLNPFALVPDLSLYMLQLYGVIVAWEEYLAIKIHDGLYDDTNKPYYLARNKESKLRSNLPVILHQADLMASRHEYEKWLNESGEKPAEEINMNYGKRARATKFTKMVEGKDSSSLAAFNEMFNK